MSRMADIVRQAPWVDVRTHNLLIAVVLSVGLATSSRAAPLFARSLALGTGNNPFAVAIADVDRDGRLDLLVADYGSGTVSVVLGRADGGYSARAYASVGGAPSALAVADLNGDGLADLAVTNAVSNTVSVLLGNGDGTFGVAKASATGMNPCAVAIADLDADARPDLLVVNLASNTVSVLLGRPGGAFPDRLDVGVGTSPHAFAVGDLNGDGKPDLAVANQFGVPLSILRVRSRSLDLEQLGALPPGVYFLRLRQGVHEVRARATVLQYSGRRF